MASLANVLVDKILGHSTAEKAFRPWWDNMQDFLVYGLVMLGLIVAPTAITNGTPLDCNFCRNGFCLNHNKGDYDMNRTDPNFNAMWIKKYCTVTAVDGFITYFPFILLVIALVNVLIERVFIRIFKAGFKLDTFYNLLVKEAMNDDALLAAAAAASSSNPTTGGAAAGGGTSVVDGSGDRVMMMSRGDSIIPMDLDNTRTAIEVSYSFSDSSSYFWSYMVRTMSESVMASMLLAWILIYGLPIIQQEEHIFCDVHGYLYECIGHPQQFYMYVLFIVIAILTLYLICCIYSILWLAIPYMGSLSRVMYSYRRELRKQFGKKGEQSDQQLLGNLYNVYYKNRDLKLLLDLLASSSGIAMSLRVLTLFDLNLRMKSEPTTLDITATNNDDGTFDALIQFEEAEAIVEIFGKMSNIVCVYTVELMPPPPHARSSVHVFRSKGLGTTEDLTRKSDAVKMELIRKPKRVVYSGLDMTQEYTVRVCTVVNGKAIAKKSKRVSSSSASP